MATIGNAGIRRFRRWYNQYRATHGTTPPSNLVQDFLQGEIEARIARADESRRIGIMERGQERQFALQKEAIEAEKRAATITGATNLGVAGLLLEGEYGMFSRAGKAIGTKLGIGTPAAGSTMVGTGAAITPSSPPTAGSTMVGTGASITPATPGVMSTGQIAKGAVPITAAAPTAGSTMVGTGASITPATPGVMSAGQIAAPSTAAPGVGVGTVAVPAAAGFVASKIGEDVFGSKEAGVASGTAAGAATGFAIGGPAGAVVGGITGLFSSVVGGGK